MSYITEALRILDKIDNKKRNLKESVVLSEDNYTTDPQVQGSNQIKQTQQLLKDAGYEVEVTGTMDDATKAAFADYKKKGPGYTAEINKIQKTSKEGAGAELAQNDPEEIKKLQQQLVDAGYNIAVDGKLGPQTREAYTQFMNSQAKGTAQNGWVQKGEDWFYFKNGVMEKGKWVGDYYLGDDGKMAKNTTTPDGYTVGADGKYIKDAESQSASEGEAKSGEGWVKSGTAWYYYRNNNPVRNEWIGDYYVGEDGHMLTNTTTPDGYKVGADGKWVDANKEAQGQENK